MLKARNISLRGALAGTACLVSICLLPIAGAQQNKETEVREEITVSQADISAAHDAGPGLIHALPARTPGAQERTSALHREMARRAAAAKAAAATADAAVNHALTGPYFYPADVASGGGPTLATTTQHALYVNAKGSVASNWGNPERFLRDLNESTFVHLLDQYAGSTEDDRYPLGSHARVHYSVSGNILYDHDIVAIVHAAAVERGGGLGNLYHVFLPKGTDECFDVPAGQSPVCYSPDNPSTWAFCAYHGAAQFSDVGLILYSVEPYQNVPGCDEATPSANGQLADSTYTTLAHETFEAISDPIPGGGYFNQNSGFFGAEIGDECIDPINSMGAEIDPTLILNGRPYNVQLEYSNTYHACAAVP